MATGSDRWGLAGWGRGRSSHPPFRANGALTSCLAVAIVLAWLNGILVRTVAVDVQFFGETADRSDYRVAAGAGVMTALLLVLGLVVVVSWRAPAWLGYLTGAGIATAARARGHRVVELARD